MDLPLKHRKMAITNKALNHGGHLIPVQFVTWIMSHGYKSDFFFQKMLECLFEALAPDGIWHSVFLGVPDGVDPEFHSGLLV